MTVSVDLAAGPLVFDAAEYRFYRSSSANPKAGWRRKRKDDHEWQNPTWVRDTRYRVAAVDSGENSTPGEAVLILHTSDSAADGAVKAAADHAYLVGGSDLAPNGSGQTIMRPPDLFHMDQVKITLVATAPANIEYEVTVFVGLVVDWAQDFVAGTISVRCVDYRHILACRIVRGVYYYSPASQTYQWIPDALPVFNPGGMPNRYYEEGDENICITRAGKPSPAATDPQQYHRRGDVLNYLRRVWWESPPRDSDGNLTIAPVTDFFNWPEASPNGFAAGLFTNPDGYEVRWPEFSPGGQDLGAVIDLLVLSKGNFAWGLKYGTDDRPTIDVWGTGADSVTDTQRRFTIKWGDIDDAATVGPELSGGTLAFTAETVRNKVLTLGDHVTKDITFSTVDGTLVEGWLADQEATWRALTDQQKDEANLYPSVYRRWVVPDDIDWTQFGAQGDYMAVRVAGALLCSFDTTTQDSGGRPRHLRMRIERSDDGGSTWEELPERFGVSPLPAGQIGVLLAGGVRRSRKWYDGQSSREVWSWDTASNDAHDLRITVRVVFAERLAGPDAEDLAASWPVLEEMRIDNRFKYWAQRDAFIPNDSGAALLDGGTVSELGDGSDVSVRDDQTELGALGTEYHDQIGYPKFVGDLVLVNIRLIQPGDYLERIVAGGSTGSREDIRINSAVRSVSVMPEEPSTTIHLESD